MKHYYITTEPPMILSDEEIKKGDDYFEFEKEKIGDSISSISCKKIIAGLQNQPTIDYSALSDEEFNVIGWVDIEKFAENILVSHKDYKEEGFSEYQNGRFNGIIEGLKTAQSLNDKNWSDEDVKKVIDLAMVMSSDLNNKFLSFEDVFERILNILNKPKLIPIEAIVQDNKVKILKVL